MSVCGCVHSKRRVSCSPWAREFNSLICQCPSVLQLCCWWAEFPQVICAMLVQKLSHVSLMNTARNSDWLFVLSEMGHLSSSNADFSFRCGSPGAPQLPLMPLLPETTREDRVLKTSSSLLSSSLLSRRRWTRASLSKVLLIFLWFGSGNK